ncbi:major facilitator superfamily domain-containing protein [Suillus bovinus]|uniref:major facilitator superfamily domain-containing protein n=1 Tax=Suillus bovinus TaxID=48563 RepID=UPI001B860CAA|nr:major facilitator superfamily domain-containing protein [Suillus bovinus]KAG2126871.1 major facilitator superfamily domain-containing protein [Suillus bovinus]
MTGFSALPFAEDSLNDESRWIGRARILGPPLTRLPTLTIGLLGVSVLWSVEMSYASPYLLSLGLSKPLMAVVFLAGPLSGLIVQPLIGVLADNSKSRFGRRRPLIGIGAALCCITTLLFGYARPFAALFTTPGSSSHDSLAIWLAVLSIYCIDFSINAVQALDRALLVDTLPPSDQPSGNAWAARMQAIGGVLGFFVGEIDLPQWLPFLGHAQLEDLVVIASLLLISTHLLTSICVKERILVATDTRAQGLKQEIYNIWNTLTRLPRVIKQICYIQFFSSLAWFPVLFYTTVYIGELHKQVSPPPADDDSAVILEEEATRLGTRALFYSALVSLAANIIMPFFVIRAKEVAISTPLRLKKPWLERVQVHLATLWAFSLLVFALCMAATFVVSSVGGATFIMSVTGFCWAIVQWAPFTLLAEAILSHPATDEETISIYLEDTRLNLRSRTDDDEQDADETRHLVDSDLEDPTYSRSASPEQENGDYPRIMINHEARVSQIDINDSSAQMSHDALPRRLKKNPNGLSSQAGAILGIHNIFIVVPQFLVTGLSSIIFAIFDPQKSVLHGHHPGNAIPVNGTIITSGDVMRQILDRDQDPSVKTGPNAIAIIFRLGGVAAAVAFALCWRLARELRHMNFDRFPGHLGTSNVELQLYIHALILSGRMPHPQKTVPSLSISMGGPPVKGRSRLAISLPPFHVALSST